MPYDICIHEKNRALETCGLCERDEVLALKIALTDALKERDEARAERSVLLAEKEIWGNEFNAVMIVKYQLLKVEAQREELEGRLSRLCEVKDSCVKDLHWWVEQRDGWQARAEKAEAERDEIKKNVQDFSRRLVNELSDAVKERDEAREAVAGLREDGVFRWITVANKDEMESFYRSILPKVTVAARACGYAIAVHGSLRRDLDLIAVPWIETASDKDTLARNIHRTVCGIEKQDYQWEQKPLGRVAICFPICFPEWNEPSLGHIDLSVIDSRTGPSLLASVRRDALEECKALALKRVRCQSNHDMCREAEIIAGMIEDLKEKK